MKRSIFRGTFPLLFAFAAVALATSGLAAQQEARVRHRELAATGAPVLYDAITQIHPEWLPPGSATRVAVFVNGTYRGDASELTHISTDSVGSVRWSTAEHVNPKFNRYPAGEFNVVLFVATRGTGPRPRGRFTFSADGGLSVTSMSSAAQRALRTAGYDQDHYIHPIFGTVETFTGRGSSMPAAVGATLNYRVRDVWGVALTGLHTGPGWGGGYSQEAVQAVSTSVAGSEGAILITADYDMFRVGLGLAYQRVSWDWSTGVWESKDKRSSSSSSLGAAAEILVAIPVPRIPARPAMRVFGRYYFPTETEYGPLGEPLEVGGFMLTFALGVAAHF